MTNRLRSSFKINSMDSEYPDETPTEVQSQGQRACQLNPLACLKLESYETPVRGQRGTQLLNPLTWLNRALYGVNSVALDGEAKVQIVVIEEEVDSVKLVKQKIVIKVQMHSEKCRTEAKKIAAIADGVTSLALDGADKDRIVVIGEGVDSVNLARSLRKKVGHANIMSVQEEKDRGKDEKDICKGKKKEEEKNPNICTIL